MSYILASLFVLSSTLSYISAFLSTFMGYARELLGMRHSRNSLPFNSKVTLSPTFGCAILKCSVKRSVAFCPVVTTPSSIGIRFNRLSRSVGVTTSRSLSDAVFCVHITFVAVS